MVRLHFKVFRDDEQFNVFLDEFQKETDRAAAVLGGAYLDDLLGQLLQASWVDDSEPCKRLLDRTLASFSARLNVAYALGLITDHERRDLDLVRDIRNTFAHELQGLSFEDSAIASKCASFSLTRERFRAEPELERSYPKEPRKLFNLATALLAYYLTRRVRNAERFPEPDPPLWPRYDIGEQRGNPPGAA